MFFFFSKTLLPNNLGYTKKPHKHTHTAVIEMDRTGNVCFPSSRSSRGGVIGQLDVDRVGFQKHCH